MVPLSSRRRSSLRSFRRQEAERKRCERSTAYGEDYGPQYDVVEHPWTKERDIEFRKEFDSHFRRIEEEKPGTPEYGWKREKAWDEAKNAAKDTTIVELYPNGMGLRIQRGDDFAAIWAKGRKRLEIEGSVRELPDGTVEDNRKLKEGSLRAKRRGKCRGATPTVCARMRDKMYKVDRSSLPVMLTLGWPKSQTPDSDEAKRCLDAFLHALVRKFPRACGFWKLEFGEEGGLPHFHLLIWGAQPWKGWCAKTWYRICRTGNPDHLTAGTSVEKIRSYRGTLAYAGKNYMPKSSAQMPPGDWGRVWGMFNQKMIPWDTPMTVHAPGRVGLWFSRIQRRYMHALSGGKVKTGGRGRVLWKSPDQALQWLRVLEWAETMPVPVSRIEQIPCPF